MKRFLFSVLFCLGFAGTLFAMGTAQSGPEGAGPAGGPSLITFLPFIVLVVALVFIFKAKNKMIQTIFGIIFTLIGFGSFIYGLTENNSISAQFSGTSPGTIFIIIGILGVIIGAILLVIGIVGIMKRNK